MGMTQTYATGAGQRATLALDDGTRVILAPQTTLRLVHFDASSRTVMLDGEAYFEVLHATGTPFMVRAGSATARVLGTAFMVRHYRNDARARIAVTSGKVAISAASPHVAAAILTTGHVGDVTDSTVNVNTNGDAMSEAGWVRGKLIFHDVPLTQVLATLSRWYGYQFRFTDPALQQQNVTVGFNTQSSAAALALLEQVLGVKATVVGDTVTLAPRSARPSQSNTRIRTYDVWIPTKEVGR
jgi:transmembrane sensor